MARNMKDVSTSQVLGTPDSLRASRRAVHLSSSARIYFSVSDIQAPDYTGDAHGIWTRDTVRQLAKPRSIAGREIAGNAH